MKPMRGKVMGVGVKHKQKQKQKQNDVPYNMKNVVISDGKIRQIVEEYGGELALDVDLHRFKLAFVHKSYCTRKNENYVNGNVNCPEGCLPLQEVSNERLEYLGDAILNVCVSSYLMTRYPKGGYSFLTRVKTKIVNGKMLASLSKKIGFGRHLVISRQIDENNGRTNRNLLEDVFEAFVGAIFEVAWVREGGAGGYESAKTWVIGVLEELIDFGELVADVGPLEGATTERAERMSRLLPVLPGEIASLDVLELERRHFAGDVLLNACTGWYLYERYPAENEGFLTTMRTRITNKRMLSTISSEEIGAEESGVLEIMIGSAFKNGETEADFRAAMDWITNIIEEHIDFADIIHVRNYKDDLFKFFQHNMASAPVVTFVSVPREDAPGACRAVVTTRDGASISYATAVDRKTAEQDACMKALDFYGKLGSLGI